MGMPDHDQTHRLLDKPLGEHSADELIGFFEFCADRFVEIHGDSEGDLHVRGLRQYAEQLRVVERVVHVLAVPVFDTERLLALVRLPGDVQFVGTIATELDKVVPGCVAVQPEGTDWLQILKPKEKPDV